MCVFLVILSKHKLKLSIFSLASKSHKHYSVQYLFFCIDKCSSFYCDLFAVNMMWKKPEIACLFRLHYTLYTHVI